MEFINKNVQSAGEQNKLNFRQNKRKEPSKLAEMANKEVELRIDKRKLYDRLRWANLSDEKKEKRKQKMKEYRANLTDEERERQKRNKREYERRRWANITEEEAEQKKKRSCELKLSEERMAKQREKTRRYYANLTEERKEQLKEKQRIYHQLRYANLTKEQKEKIKSRKSELTDEQREKKRVRERERRRLRQVEQSVQNSDKQRQFNRKQSDIITEEEREKRRLKMRKYRAKLSCEDREKRNEKTRIYYANLPEEEKIKRRERKREYERLRRFNLTNNEKNEFSDINKQKESFVSSETIENDRLNDKLNIITRLKQIIAYKLHYLNISDVLDRIPTKIFKEILSKFGIEFGPQFFIKYLTEIIKTWYEHNDRVNFTSRDLLNSINSCLSYVTENCIENVIEITCSLKQLKMFFHNSDVKLSTIEPEHFYNWPYISMRIRLPKFTMVRTNSAKDQFFLAKNLHRSTHVRKHTILYSTRNDNSSEMSAKSVLTYLKQFERFITSCSDDRLISKDKIKLIAAITEFTSDINLCESLLRTGTEYYAYLNEYPYVRSVAESRVMSEFVYLFQQCHPTLSFSIEIIEGTRNDNFEESLLNNFDDLIECRCELCDENLGSVLNDRVNEHLTEYHGSEGEWNCLNCGNSFTTVGLSKQRWKHNC